MANFVRPFKKLGWFSEVNDFSRHCEIKDISDKKFI